MREPPPLMEWMALGNRVLRRALVATGVATEVRRVNGVEVHAYRAERGGKGPPLLLVHGLGSSANAFFRTLLPLAKRFRVVHAIDLPGNGFSPVPDAGPLTALQMVELILEYRRSVIGEPAFLVGNSLGGGMSMRAAFTEPEAFCALALVSPAGARISDERFESLLQSFRVEDRKGARTLAHKLFAKPPLPLLLFADELRKMVSTQTVKHLVGGLTTADFVSPEELKRLTMPTLLIWGDREKLLPYESLDFFRTHLPAHADIQEVRGFGHMPQMEHPRAFVERVEKFALRSGLVQAA